MRTPIHSDRADFLRRLEVYRNEPEVLRFDHEMAGMALAVGLLVGGGFPFAAAMAARAAELAWPDREFPWAETNLG